MWVPMVVCGVGIYIYLPVAERSIFGSFIVTLQPCSECTLLYG